MQINCIHLKKSKKEETVLFSGKIDVDVVDKEQDIVEVTQKERLNEIHKNARFGQ